MVPYRPDRIFFQESARRDPIACDILDRLPEIPAEPIREVEEVLPELNRGSDPRTSGKRTLILARYPGRFLKPCPGSGAEICCNYYVLNFASNCHFECTYCVLQTFLNNPAMIVFTNFDDLAAEVRATVEQNGSSFFRIGTGEMSDSLAIDDLTAYSRRLVPLFASLPNAVLELKTKSDRIQNLEGLEHRGRTIVSWSLNSRLVCATEELKTASLEQRLHCARQVQRWGYKVGFHFDPVIEYPGWEDDYRETVREVFSAVDPSRIAWVSLGALRFTPQLRDVVRERFPKSKIPYGEFVPGHHGKLRYFRPVREEIYLKMSQWITDAAPRAFVYLCMEPRLVWQRSLGWRPDDTAVVSNRLDSLVRGS